MESERKSATPSKKTCGKQPVQYRTDKRRTRIEKCMWCWMMFKRKERATDFCMSCGPMCQGHKHNLHTSKHPNGDVDCIMPTVKINGPPSKEQRELNLSIYKAVKTRGETCAEWLFFEYTRHATIYIATPTLQGCATKNKYCILVKTARLLGTKIIFCRLVSQ